eukprot:762822-Hanusia_phi.AAC.3
MSSESQRSKQDDRADYADESSNKQIASSNSNSSKAPYQGEMAMCHDENPQANSFSTFAQECVEQWSEGYMETVAQQRVRWMSFLGCHTGECDAKIVKGGRRPSKWTSRNLG